MRLEKSLRQEAPGEFAALSDGLCHYQLSGPVGGPAVVLIHGFSVPSFIWDQSFQPVVEAGFRTLRFDLFGRGYSDRPSAAHTHDLFVRQLAELLPAVGIQDQVSLVGLSMGGAISAAFALSYPELVKRLILISPAGVMKQSLGIRVLRLPLIGELLFLIGGEATLIKGLSQNADQLEKFDSYLRQFRRQMAFPGYKRALLSSLRGDLLCEMHETYLSLGQRSLPSLLIWGRDDQLTHFEQSSQIRAAMPGISFQPLDDAGHLPHIEKSELVNSILIQFLRT